MIFSLLARFAPTEVCKSEAHREWNLRPYAVGLLVEAPLHPSMMVLIILMLATVTFDGLIETPLWVEIADDLGLRISTLPFTLTADGMRTAVYTLGLAGTALLFLSVYLACALLIARFADTSPAAGIARRQRHGALRTACLFVCTLIPIAIAYHLAHYLSFLLMAFQYLIPLASDPLGLGWDLFGTTNYFVRAGVIDARFVWYSSVIAIVIGHIAAVCLAHAMALREFSTKQAALRSQYPMLALMIGYTMVSLWIIAQPIVSSRPG